MRILWIIFFVGALGILGYTIVTVRLPIGIAIQVLETYPSYFSFGFDENDWNKEYSYVELAGLDLFSNKLLRDWITQESITEVNRSGFRPFEDVGSTVDLIASSIHRTVLSQRHLDEVPFENWSTSRRLILGWGYCDHINETLASALAEVYGAAQTWDTRYPEEGVSKEVAGLTTHTLAAIQLDGVRIYADAWSSVHSFVIDSPGNLKNSVRRYESIPILPPDKTFGSQKQAQGLLIAAAYTNGSKSKAFRSTFLPSGRLDFRISLNTRELLVRHSQNTQMLYLLGRLFYLYRFFDESRTFFLAIARTGCENTIHCRLARKALEYSFH